ncbi:hypothetical protein V1514DRAFT_321994 [Lipomyces japonicus]|uniref:uncharacterized protein n=1 Tax=Lipomyces japonicus TaxID=56871 RepID=UPI0034CFC4EC
MYERPLRLATSFKPGSEIRLHTGSRNNAEFDITSVVNAADEEKVVKVSTILTSFEHHTIRYKLGLWIIDEADLEYPGFWDVLSRLDANRCPDAEAIRVIPDCAKDFMSDNSQ